LQTGNPYDLVPFASLETAWPRDVERLMHRKYAERRQKGEWLDWPRIRLHELIADAQNVAREIEERKAKVQPFLDRPANGETRRATSEEFEWHHHARKLTKDLVPATLRLKTAK